MNARQEFLKQVKRRELICAKLQREDGAIFLLKQGYNAIELDVFLESINFEYDEGSERQELFGFIWHTDATWSERYQIYNGAEWWEFKEIPNIDEEFLKK